MPDIESNVWFVVEDADENFYPIYIYTLNTTP